MYEVYSQQRPGRPRWTLGANAFVLLLTVGLAAAVSNYKSRALLVPLGKDQVYPRGQLQCALPDGWQVLPEKETAPGIVVVARETQNSNHQRQLFIFRDAPSLLGVPSRDAAAALVKQLTVMELIDRVEPMQASQVGDLPAVEIGTVKQVRLSRVASREMYCISRAGMGPDGEIVGIILAVPDAVEARDRALLNQVAERLQLSGLSVEEDSAAVMKYAGISWELPEGVQVFAERPPAPPRLRLIGGSGATLWYLSAYRVPLLPGRTPEHLIRDFYLNHLEVTEMPAEPITEKLGDRLTARVQFALPPTEPDSVLLLCAQTDEETALLLIGRHESEGEEELFRAARDLSSTAAVAPYSDHVDLDNARRLAREWLEDVSSRGLKTIWGNDEGRRQTFAVRAPALRLGTETRMLTSRLEGSDLLWELQVDFVLDRAGFRSIEKWRMPDNGRSFRYAVTQIQDGKHLEYVENWSGGGEIRSKLDGAATATRTIRADPVFTTEPLLIAASAALAAQNNPSGLVFSSTQTYLPDLCHWTLKPVGKQPLPGGVQPVAEAVLVQRDFNPWPIMLYFDENRSLLAVQSPGGRYQIRTGNASRGSTTE